MKRSRLFPPRSPSSAGVRARPPEEAAPPPAVTPGGDAYADLLRDTRGLRDEPSRARELWISKLPIDRREEVLFELEILLKGLACFANPRNHPGPARRTPIVAQDYREHLTLARDGMQRIVHLSRMLLGREERAYVFQRYLEMLLPDDRARSRLVRGAMSQDTPEESLFVLRHAMTNLVEVTSGITRLSRLPYRTFYATLSVAHREVSQSAFFNPLAALEFRPEFDRITNARLLELMQQVQGEQARRLVALTFLSLLRMLRYIALIERAVEEPRSAGLVYLVLSVLRSDARALTGYLRKQVGSQLAGGFEREIFQIPASQITSRYDGMIAQAEHLLSIKSTLGGVAANLRLELRRAFEHDLPAPDRATAMDAFRAAIASTSANLRPALQNGVLVLGQSLGVRLDEHGLFDDIAERRSLSNRLRRDVWMFAQIVRAFGAKARVTPNHDDEWGGPSSLQFVRQFLSYFNAMGYPLLRAADYPRVGAFMAALSALEEIDLLDPERLEHAVGEAEEFYVFLYALFDQIGQRDELQDVPFDRRAAAESLTLYLGDY